MSSTRLRRFWTVLRSYLAHEDPPPDPDPLPRGRIVVVEPPDPATQRLLDLMQPIATYANIISLFGSDSREAREVRQRYADVVGFGELADALDRVKRELGGSGVDWAADDQTDP